MTRKPSYERASVLNKYTYRTPVGCASFSTLRLAEVLTEDLEDVYIGNPLSRHIRSQQVMCQYLADFCLVRFRRFFAHVTPGFSYSGTSSA
jgi:hypothetical protein